MNMTMGSAIPGWLTPVASTYIALAVLSTAVLAADIYLGRRRHHDVASELVWVTSGLYLGPLAVAAYLNRGRTAAEPASKTAPTTLSSDGGGGSAARTAGSDRGNAATAVLPGGGASAVAHLIAVPFVASVGWTVAGLSMWPTILVIAVLATAMLAGYELVASAHRTAYARGLSVGAAFVGALVTVAAFDVGMVGWMLVLHLNDAMPAATESTFWFLMQIGVIVGLITGYPAVKWLMKRNQTFTPA